MNDVSGAISTVSRNDSTVSHSSTEAELKALDMICREVVYMRRILEFLGFKQDAATKIFVDNKSAIELCTLLKVNSKVKHINVRIHYIRELVNERVVELCFIPSELNVADVLTKALVRVLHERHVRILLYGHQGCSPINPIFYASYEHYMNVLEMDNELLLCTSEECNAMYM